MDALKIEYLPCSALKPYENNTRKHQAEDVAAIAESIRQFGFDDPIGRWSDDNIIVEGHGRLLAAESLGMETVPCIRLDHLTDEQRRAYALAHNKTAELSGWNFDTLNAELAGIDGIDMSAFGFTPVEPQSVDAVDDEYEPVIPEEPKARRGMVWVLGNHRLMCGDSSDFEDVRKLAGGGQ